MVISLVRAHLVFSLLDEYQGQRTLAQAILAILNEDISELESYLSETREFGSFSRVLRDF